MLIRVDPSSTDPVFQQIMDEIKSAIARGACAPGEMIPSVRQMAAHALVNPNTVARAYRELEREKLLYTRRGLGVFVAPNAQAACRNGRRRDIRDKLKSIAAQAGRAGIRPDELQETLARALAQHHPGRGTRKSARRRSENAE